MDSNKRIVALSNLEAMCKRISGTCHRFTVSKVTPNRVQVTYSNPNEYGTEFPMVAVFPCWAGKGRSVYGSPDDRFVVLDIIDVIRDNWGGEGWQAFQQLLDCPELYRANPDSDDWKTCADIRGEEMSPEAVAKRIVAHIARAAGDPAVTIRNLETVLKLCFDSLPETRRSQIENIAEGKQ